MGPRQERTLAFWIEFAQIRASLADHSKTQLQVANASGGLRSACPVPSRCARESKKPYVVRKRSTGEELAATIASQPSPACSRNSGRKFAWVAAGEGVAPKA